MELTSEVKQLKYLINNVFLAGVSTSRAVWKRIESGLMDISSTLTGNNLPLLVLESTLDNKIYLSFPRDQNYALNVLEWFIALWKKYDWEGEEFFEIAKPKISKLARIGYKTYIGLDNGASFTLLESLKGITNGTTGLVPWGAAKILYYWSINNQCVFKDKNVIELGAGIGFLPVALLSYMNLAELPLSITATDCNSAVLSILKHNISLLKSSQDQYRPSKESLTKYIIELDENLQKEHSSFTSSEWSDAENFLYKGVEVMVKQLDWCSYKEEEASYDVILAADVVYSHHLIPYLVKTIKKIFDRCMKNYCLGRSTALSPSTVSLQSTELYSKTNNKYNAEEQSCEVIQKCHIPVAYVACTRRNQETLLEFLEEVVLNQMKYEQIFQTNLGLDESLFAYDESHLPVKIFKILPAHS